MAHLKKKVGFCEVNFTSTTLTNESLPMLARSCTWREVVLKVKNDLSSFVFLLLLIKIIIFLDWKRTSRCSWWDRERKKRKQCDHIWWNSGKKLEFLICGVPKFWTTSSIVLLFCKSSTLQMAKYWTSNLAIWSNWKT